MSNTVGHTDKRRNVIFERKIIIHVILMFKKSHNSPVIQGLELILKKNNLEISI